jgi:hypothetical protein
VAAAKKGEAMRCALDRKFLVAGELLVAAALFACASAPPRPYIPVNTPGDFQNVMKNLHADAKQAVSGAPEQVIIIGYTDVNGRKELTYIPSELHVHQGDTPTIGWIAWDGSFTLTFYSTNGNKWPFDPPEAPITSGGAPSSATRRVSKSADTSSHHFKVDLTLPSGETLHDYDCPPIIVE